MITVFADDNESSRRMMKMVMNSIDPMGSHYFAENAAKAIDLVAEHNPDVLFLDIEMPGLSGIEATNHLKQVQPELNVIFVTGHPEYARDALRLYCSGFIEKPYDEYDVLEALKHLRYPLKQTISPLVVRCDGHFAVFFKGEPFTFKRRLTMELFAYLVYKNGAMCTNGDLLGILWDGDPEKGDHLRQLVKDMRDCFDNAGISDIIIKRHGSLGLNTSAYELKGNAASINEEFNWI